MSRRGENIYYRKDKRWEGRYPKGRKANGKIKYGSVYGKTYNEVRWKLYPLKIEYQNLCELNGSLAITMKEWVEIWLMEVKDSIEIATFSSYRHKMRTYILPFLGEYPLNELTQNHIQELVQRWKKHPLSVSSIRVNLQVVKNCLNQAINQGHLIKNPCQGIKLPKSEGKKIQAMSLNQQKQIEKAAISYPKGRGLPTLLALRTGMRIGEVAALKWENVDFENDLIYVSHTLQRVTLEGRSSKTLLIYATAKTAASQRTIPMGENVRRWLWEHRKSSKSAFVFSSGEGPCEPRLITYHFHQICQRAGISGIHFHQLRHTFATRCVEANANISSVSRLLGHTSTQMTLDTYTHSLLQPMVETMQLMEQAVS
ncbi:site-specific integrase [Enterococcus florum]|uniref:Site-specific integrase n=1 Tax=Enterococcus florum TaxID=2480627 RepID=A0A4P5PK41_9ENTE|nr:site-specific integrase [Enterococcus florum]GCF95942.1 site-specific integrase [Enterococcus florum]